MKTCTILLNYLSLIQNIIFEIMIVAKKILDALKFKLIRIELKNINDEINPSYFIVFLFSNLIPLINLFIISFIDLFYFICYRMLDH